jgi:endonuclease/exonuclease/phosphatase family metal-dependent hydrolase
MRTLQISLFVALAFTCALGLLGFGGCSAPAAPLRLDLAPAPGTVRVVSLNVAGGFSASYRTAAAGAQQRAFLAALQPDAVCYQEAWGAVAGWQAQYAPGPGWWRGDALEQVAGQPSGVAVWVRQGVAVGDSWTVPLKWEEHPRDAILVAAGGILLACAHLDTGTSDNRVREVEQVYAATEVQGPYVRAPELFVGDMNDFGDVIARGADAEALTPVGTYDQAWSRVGGAAALVPTHGTDALVSDHTYAVVADVPLP